MEVDKSYIEIPDLFTRIQIELIESNIKCKFLESILHTIQYEEVLDRKIMIEQHLEEIYDDILIDNICNIYDEYRKYGIPRLYDLSLLNYSTQIEYYVSNTCVQNILNEFQQYIYHCFINGVDYNEGEEYVDYNEFKEEYVENDLREIALQSSCSKYMMNMIKEISNCYVYY